MQNINFFTPVKYTNYANPNESFLVEAVDDYFFIGGDKAHIVETSLESGAEKAVLSEEKSSFMLTALKIISYCTAVIPAVMLIIKSILRSFHNYEKIDPKQELEKGIVVSEASKEKIQEALPEIIFGQEHKNIVWLSKGNTLVFQLADDVNHVYKMSKPCCFQGNHRLPSGGNEETKARFENMVKAKAVCIANNLCHLVIPQSTLLTLNREFEYTLIVEEKMEIDRDEKAQQRLYTTSGSEMDQAIQELSIFIAKTGFNDVTWRNIPIIKENQACQPSRRIALIDLEHMQDPVSGFLGGANGSVGLINCVAHRHIDLVAQEMGKQGIHTEPAKIHQYKEVRLAEMEESENLTKFYEDQGITNAKTPISIDIEDLGLPLDEVGEFDEYIEGKEGSGKWQKRTISLREVANEVVNELNRLIEISPARESIQSERLLEFNREKAPFNRYLHLGLPKGQLLAWSDKDRAKLWINQILRALVEKEALFQVKEILYGFSIQA